MRRAGRVRQDDDPVLEWCLGAAVGKADRRGYLCPAEARPERKIGAAVALMVALSRAQASDVDPQPSIPGFFDDPLSA